MGIACHVEQVAAQDEIRGAADRPAPDLAQHRFRAFPDAHEAAHVVAHELQVAHRIPGAVAVVDGCCAVGGVPVAAIGGEIVAGGQGVADPAQHDGRDRRRAAGPVDAVGNTLNDRVGQRVLLVRPVDGDDGDAVALFVQGLGRRILIVVRSVAAHAGSFAFIHCGFEITLPGLPAESRSEPDPEPNPAPDLPKAPCPVMSCGCPAS